ncbi:hypothetical protein [Lysinibacillus yapensis]|nr:hypothetical protein [Lysinibacillus yapensis]
MNDHQLSRIATALDSIAAELKSSYDLKENYHPITPLVNERLKEIAGENEPFEPAMARLLLQ